MLTRGSLRRRARRPDTGDRVDRNIIFIVPLMYILIQKVYKHINVE